MIHVHKHISSYDLMMFIARYIQGRCCLSRAVYFEPRGSSCKLMQVEAVAQRFAEYTGDDQSICAFVQEEGKRLMMVAAACMASDFV